VLLAERSEESYGDGTNVSNQLTTLRKETFVTWKLIKTSKKRSADVLNNTQVADNDEVDEEDKGVVVTPPRDAHGRFVW
jgi:hypothetical protein